MYMIDTGHKEIFCRPKSKLTESERCAVSAPASMRSTVVLVAVCAMVAVVHAHVCLLNPAQRGGPHSITMAADPWCKLTVGPCGGQAPAAGMVEYHRNDNLTIAWQKNQDHWTAATPGYFSVGYATSPSAPITELARVPDTADPSLTVYETHVVMNEPSPTGVLSVEYYTGLGFNFYACADVVVN